MATMTVRITGTHPLKMHNSQLANPLHPITKRLKAVTAKRKKSDDDQIAIMEIEFEGGLYFDEKIGPYLPDRCIKATIIEGAKKTKSGKMANESLAIVEQMVKLEYDGPRTISGLWNENFRDVSSVGVGMSRVMRTRPMFREWAAQFTILYDEKIINEADILIWLETAGTRTGIGDHRPDFGKFSVKIV